MFDINSQFTYFSPNIKELDSKTQRCLYDLVPRTQLHKVQVVNKKGWTLEPMCGLQKQECSRERLSLCAELERSLFPLCFSVLLRPGEANQMRSFWCMEKRSRLVPDSTVFKGKLWAAIGKKTREEKQTLWWISLNDTYKGKQLNNWLIHVHYYGYAQWWHVKNASKVVDVILKQLCVFELSITSTLQYLEKKSLPRARLLEGPLLISGTPAGPVRSCKLACVHVNFHNHAIDQH